MDAFPVYFPELLILQKNNNTDTDMPCTDNVIAYCCQPPMINLSTNIVLRPFLLPFPVVAQPLFLTSHAHKR